MGLIHSGVGFERGCQSRSSHEFRGRRGPMVGIFIVKRSFLPRSTPLVGGHVMELQLKVIHAVGPSESGEFLSHYGNKQLV